MNHIGIDIIHSSPPYAMGWASTHTLVVGSDKKMVIYTENGVITQPPDCFKDPAKNNFIRMCISSICQATCVHIHGRRRVGSWCPRKNFMGEDIYMVARTPGKVLGRESAAILLTECYLKMDRNTLTAAWTKVTVIAIKFLDAHWLLILRL